MNNITCISGLFRNIRGGKEGPSERTIQEIKDSLKINPHYRQQLVCYADCNQNAEVLRNEGCYVHKIFNDAPDEIVFDTKHKMKHWMMYNAVKEFKNVLWIDWDTYNRKLIDKHFIEFCLSNPLPKFTWIKNYWAIVNCAVYYLNEGSLDIMEKSFSAKVSEPNDELLWAHVLPNNVRELKDYWLNDFVVNIWAEADFADVTSNTYFLHLKDFSMNDNKRQNV